MAAIEEARARRPVETRSIRQIVLTPVKPGSVNPALLPLRMAVKLDPLRDTARIALEPWLVEAALERRGDVPFTLEEQREIWKATRTPWKVNWPAWWSYRG